MMLTHDIKSYCDNNFGDALELYIMLFTNAVVIGPKCKVPVLT